MSQTRLGAPPQLPGFEAIRPIGSGGYADVYLYQQHAPRREVAIKVLYPSALSGGDAADYAEEANVMAMVSAHPYIVQVFQADISPDGRPFLVMEYYPGANFQERARTERLSVSQVLSVGIQLASAVEVAHRAGILHRDIKPANILTSEYGKPGLTDFGIASVGGPQRAWTDDGLTVPWSPPESLGSPPSAPNADVYSLAATLHTMLTGTSPFEVQGGDNRPLALMTRVERDPVPSTGRGDVPASLERALAQAMAKNPAERPQTAAEFGGQLQQIESELHLAVTQLEFPRSGIARGRTPADGDATRVKSVTTVHAQSEVESTRPRPHKVGEVATPAIADVPRDPKADQAVSSVTSVVHTPGLEVPDRHGPDRDRPAARASAPDVGRSPTNGARPRVDAPAAPSVVDTISRQDLQDQVGDLVAPERRSIPKVWWVVGVGAVVMATMLVALLLLGRGDGTDEPTASSEQSGAPNDNLGDPDVTPVAVAPSPIPEILFSAVSEDRYEFSWEDRGNDVTYRVIEDGLGTPREVTEPRFESNATCIEVEIVADSGLVSAPTRGCVE